MVKMYKTGDVFHCRGKGLVSKLIMYFTNSKYSHTAMFISIWEHGYVIESQGNILYPKKDGVQLIPYEKWLELGYEFEVSRKIDVDERSIAVRSLSKLHVSYDYVSLLIRKPLDMFFNIKLSDHSRLDKLFCSEYVGWILEIDGFYNMTPKDIHSYMLSSHEYLFLNNQ